MMLEVINEVLEAEKEADTVLTEARQAATRLRNEFAEEESRTLREAQAQADLRLREEIAAFRQKQDERVTAAEAALREDARKFVADQVDGFDEAVRLAVKLVRGDA